MSESNPVAYSYMRFSTPEQRKGDSIRRQTATRDAFVARNRLKLDTSLTFVDAGVSGHKGRHRSSDKYALGYFLSLVTSGRIIPGSYLIVESLDRLSREDVDEALELLLSLTRSGIKVVQLQPAEVIYEKPVEPMKLMMGIMELSRGYSESRMKSERIGAAWEHKRERARSEGVAVSRWCPHWLRKDGDRYRVIPERAAAVRRIFELCADGYGIAGIITRLTAEGHAPFGRSGRWGNSYIGQILAGRAVLGEYQPLKGKKPCGDPIPGYYPAVVREAFYYKAKAGLAERLNHTGRRSRHEVNLFQGLMWHAPDGDRFEYRWFADSRGQRANGFARYMNVLGLLSQTKLISFPVTAFETGVLSCLTEIDPASILPNQDGAAADVTSLAAEYAETEGRLRAIEDRLVAGEAVEVLVNAAKRLGDRKKALAEKLAVARLAANNPQSEAWGTCKSLIGALEGSRDLEAARLRLRSAIRRVVTRLECVLLRNGRRQIACVQIHFVGSDAIRTVFVRHRAPLTNIKDRTPGYLSWSTLKDELPGKIDIRSDHEVVRAVLTRMCEEDYWQTAFEPDRPTSRERIRQRKQGYMKEYRRAKKGRTVRPAAKAPKKMRRAAGGGREACG